MCEVIKYAVKFNGMEHGQRLEVHRALGGSRLLDPQGLLRGVEMGDIDNDELPDLDGPTRDLLASWIWSEAKFKLSPAPTSEQVEAIHSSRAKARLANRS